MQDFMFCSSIKQEIFIEVYINNDGSLFKNKIVSADILKNKIVSINGSTIANNVGFTIVELCTIRDYSWICTNCFLVIKHLVLTYKIC